MKKILFIDRDGTLIREPETDYQVDSLEKFSFVPEIFYYLGKIVREMNYTLVMVTNQDGLGTSSFPETRFWPYQQLMIDSLSGEGIDFEAVHIDRSFEKDLSPYRKPGIAMMKGYLDGNYDIEHSFVIGDRWSDIRLAKNLGCQGIFFHEKSGLIQDPPPELASLLALQTDRWKNIYHFLKSLDRTAGVSRFTNETKIKISLNLDGQGLAQVSTGLHFFDHMLDQIARHSGADLDIEVDGDLHIDEHHTIEDTAITLGLAFEEALSKKVGIQRYGFCLPMDDCLAQVALDFGGRPWLVWDVEFKREKIGDVPTEMFYHFFKSFSDHAKCNLNIKAEGSNEHHKIEAIFKAFARAVKMGIERNLSSSELPSTKGII